MILDKAYTKEEINSAGVYKIKNIETGQYYIGSSHKIRKRMNQHNSQLKNNKHSNFKLQNSWNKYGPQNFVFSILEICDKGKQRYIEQNYLDIQNPYFNIATKVESMLCPKVREATSKKLRKKYYLINPEGIQMCTDNLKEFCIQHNILRDNIAHLLVKGSSSRKYYKGWFITTDPTELKEENRYSKEDWLRDNIDTFREARSEYITYFWNTKTDKQYIIGNLDTATHQNLYLFCKEFKLNEESIRSAFNKNKNNYKHFVIYREYKHLPQPSLDYLNNYYSQHKNFRIRKERTSPYIYTAIHSSGQSFTISKDIKGFCEEHNLDTSSFLKVAKGKLKSTKGWKITRQLKS